MPFDRLIRAVDGWAGRSGRSDLFAQIGPSGWQPRNMKWVHHLDSDAFNRHVASSDAIVAHAGTGTILSALYCGKPVLVMPRRADLRETRNDHQFATARKFQSLASVHAAFDETEFINCLDNLNQMSCPVKIGAFASESLVSSIRNFIDGKSQDFAPVAPGSSRRVNT